MCRLRNVVVWVCGLWLAGGAAWADQAVELARIHTEAIGGLERLQQWRAMRATGRVITAGKELEFELIAARPNRVRVAVRADGRELVQGTDGVTPWQQEFGAETSVRALPPAEARAFAADAEFDDPLVSGSERGYVLDYAGEVTWREQTVHKVLVTRTGEEPSFLLIDPETYFIVARVTQQTTAGGREVTNENCYDDFRPVGGVILPHHIATYLDGRLLRETVLSHVLPIMEPAAETFAMPRVTPEADPATR